MKKREKVRGHLVIWSFGQNRFQVSKSSTIYKIYLYIVSEMTESENENDHFDLDHFDQILSASSDCYMMMHNVRSH